MSDFTTEVADRCRAELERWDNGHGRETVDPFCAYVGEYWAFGVKNANIDGRTTYQDSKGKKFRPAWSSAFVSYIYRMAGAGANFHYNQAHIHYIVKALRDAKAGGNSAFLGRDPVSYAPKVGDIVCEGRGTSKALTYKNVLGKYGGKVVPNGKFLPTHSDIIVAVDPAGGTVRTIGGNVQVDTVGEKRWKVNADGTLKAGPGLICVIECLL